MSLFSNLFKSNSEKEKEVRKETFFRLHSIFVEGALNFSEQLRELDDYLFNDDENFAAVNTTLVQSIEFLNRVASKRHDAREWLLVNGVFSREMMEHDEQFVEVLALHNNDVKFVEEALMRKAKASEK